VSINRINNLQKLMSQEQIDILWTEDSTDIFYLLQFKASKGLLIVTLQNVYFFVDGRYLEKASDIKNIIVLPYEKDIILSTLGELKNLKILAFSGQKLSYDRVNELFSIYLTDKKQNYKSIDLIEKLRMVKDEHEILAIKHACKITKNAFDQIDWLELEKTEWDLSQSYKKKILEFGADTFAFEPIVAFDNHAAIPHHSVSCTYKNPKQQILVDVGAKVDGYNGDMTKTILLPSASGELKKFYEIVKEGYYLIFDHLKIGITFFELLEMIHTHFKKYNVDELFLHSLGHGIGLFVHEAPFYKNHASSNLVLQENMIFTVEPGLYNPKIGGVRLENTILITKNGPESLTNLNF